jgi:hypothetical protein
MLSVTETGVTMVTAVTTHKTTRKACPAMAAEAFVLFLDENNQKLSVAKSANVRTTAQATIVLPSLTRSFFADTCTTPTSC